MECSEAREQLTDLNRGRLGAETAEAVRTHLQRCAACRSALQTEAEIRALIQARAPRYAAPPALRRRIEAALAGSSPPGESVTHDAAARTRGIGGRSRWRDWLRGHPWTLGSLAGATAVLLLVWAGSLWMTRDPVARLATRAVAEHAEYAKGLMQRPAPDPLTVVTELRSQAGFPFEPVFRGDSQVQLVAGMVSDLLGKRAATLVYRDGQGRYTTLFLMPEAGTMIPAEERMPIETFKPHHRVTSGRHLLLWKQRDLACLLVSDLDEAGMAAMFLKVRKAA
ncbi:MAG: zf-HC2 domain-containing protein [candidate division NC10 bacterium]|nr:zf-HC2 domain-containing protein [candidate division NC10 bacterium]